MSMVNASDTADTDTQLTDKTDMANDMANEPNEQSML
jgi:hypothetical protein